MVANPEKELRFTRSRQARNFAILGAVLMGVAATFLATALFGSRPPVTIPAAIPPFLLALGSFWFAYYCNRHAFIILSPVGIEFFPLLKPARNYQVWQWQEFHHAEVQAGKLCLHYDADETGGAIVSLAPLSSQAHQLFAAAIAGRMAERQG